MQDSVPAHRIRVLKGYAEKADQLEDEPAADE